MNINTLPLKANTQSHLSVGKCLYQTYRGQKNLKGIPGSEPVWEYLQENGGYTTTQNLPALNEKKLNHGHLTWKELPIIITAYPNNPHL